MNDTEIIEWLNDHAIVLGVIYKKGDTEYLKIEGEDMCFRDIVISAMKGSKK